MIALCILECYTNFITVLVNNLLQDIKSPFIAQPSHQYTRKRDGKLFISSNVLIE